MELAYSKENSQAVECLLFVATGPLTVAEISSLVELDEPCVLTILDELIEFYDNRGFQLVKIAGGYQFLTRGELNRYVELLYKPRANNLSKAALETLAIIAYCQPITRSQVESIRGVSSDSMVSGLLSKGFIEDVGRRDTPGKPILYGTTNRFLEIMGLSSIDDLPSSQSLLANDENNQDDEESTE